MVLGILRLVAAFAFLYWLPGRLAVAWLAPAVRPEGRTAVSIALGLVLVNTPAVLITGVLGLVSPFYLDWTLVVATALVEAAALLVILWRLGRLRSLVPVRPSRTSLGLLVLTVAATGFFLAYYDADMFFEDSCIVRSSVAINAHYLRPQLAQPDGDLGEAPSPYITASMHAQAGQRNTFLTHNQGQRLGPGILAAPLFALFEVFGYRVLYALQGLLLPGLGFALGALVLRRTWAAGLVAALLTFSPYALETRMFDENFLASIFGTLSLVLLLVRPAGPLLAGCAFGLFLSLRHTGVLLLPVILTYIALVPEGPRHATRRYLLGTLLFLLPELLLHAFLFASQGQVFEGAMDRVPALHNLFGWEFKLPVLLNFPFVTEPLRSPYNPFPMLAMFPLDVVRRFGVLLIALVPLGLVHLFRTGKARAWLLVGWFVPMFAMLLVMSNWVEPNKMGVPATVLAPLVLAIIAGLVALADGGMTWRRRAAWLAGGLALPIVGVLLLTRWDAPLDERVFATVPTYHKVIHTRDTVLRTEESPQYVAWEADRYSLRWLPKLATHASHPVLWRQRLERMAADLENPDIGHYHVALGSQAQKTLMGKRFYLGPLSFLQAEQAADGGGQALGAGGPAVPDGGPDATAGEPFRVTLDLGVPPIFQDAPFQSTREDAGVPRVDLTGGVTWLIRGIEVPWSRPSLSFVALRDPRGQVLLAFLPPGVPDEDRGADPPNVRHLDASAFPDGRIPLVLPAGVPVRLWDARSAVPARYYSRYAIPGADGIWLSDTTPFSQ